jgi:hypothetical protein
LTGSVQKKSFTIIRNNFKWLSVRREKTGLVDIGRDVNATFIDVLAGWRVAPIETVFGWNSSTFAAFSKWKILTTCRHMLDASPLSIRRHADERERRCCAGKCPSDSGAGMTPGVSEMTIGIGEF